MPSLEDILSVFSVSPTACLILYPDAPDYTVAEVNESFLKTVGTTRSNIIGKGLFEAFIENRDDTASKSGEVVKKSLEHVLLVKEPHKVRFQRYDLKLQDSEGFDVRYWDWDTYPVLDDHNNVQFIIHNPVDVTERVRQITQEREKYQSLFNSSPLPMWVYEDKSLKFLDVNEAAIRHYGYSKDEFLAMTLKDIRPQEDIQNLKKILKQRVSDGAFNQSSVKHLKKNGEEIFVNIESNSIVFGNKNARIVLATDITENLKVGRALLAREQRFKALVQNGSDLISILDNKGNFQYISPASKLVLGIEAENLKQKNVFDYIHEGDRKKVISQFFLLSSQKDVKISPFRFKDNNNRLRWIETVITDMSDDPAVGGIVTNSRDVTQAINNDLKIREAIERYNVVSKATNDAIYDWDLASNKVKWNKGLQAIFGHKKTSSVPQWWYNLIHPDDVERIEKQSAFLIRNNKPRWKEEYRFLCADGTYKFVLDRGYYIYNNDKQLVRMIGCMQDITERINYIQAIEEQNERFREISWAQSHLVRAPLSRIMGLTHLLSEGNAKEEATKELLSYMDSSTTELDAIIRDIIKKTEGI